MRIIKEYSLIGQQTNDDMVNAVNDFIDEGWQPLGGISIAFWGDLSCYTQAMVKYAPIGNQCIIQNGEGGCGYVNGIKQTDDKPSPSGDER